MRQSCLRAAIGGTLLLFAFPVFARETFKIPTSTPPTYKELYDVVKKDLEKDKDEDKQKAKEKQNISAYLDGAQCGGWNMDESVEGRIATVNNAPGHTGEWNGDIPSGMSRREDDLTYPGGATGLATSCDESTRVVVRTAWRDEAQGRIPITVNHPYFEDPACLWDKDMPVDGPQTPEKCQASCGWMNGFTYTDCRDENIIDFDGFSICGFWEQRYTCSDEWVEAGARGNCTQCTGSECRCDGQLASCVRSPFNNQPYASFYRRYDTSYDRKNVPDAKKDVASKNGNVACYGLYEEFDPKTHQTKPEDMRCIIDIDLQTMRETQLGKGEYGQKSNLSGAILPVRYAFNPQTSVWYSEFGRAFDFINSRLTELPDFSISYFLSKTDNALQKATVQLSEDKPLAEHSYTRAFDETAESRVISKWWQKQQTDLQTYVHGPVLRLVLPSTWAIGASTDPFLQKAAVSEKESLDDRSKRIEVQVAAGEDTLGEAISFIEKSFALQVTEEPLPVTLPLADPVELRSTAAAWCAWAAAKSTDGSCGDAPDKVKKYMESLQKYADDIEEYRALRAQLADHVTGILKLQNEVTKPLTDWMKTNVDKYKESVASRKRIAKEVAPTLESVQELLQKFNNTSNMPWCMNQRFTLPIYSLLDPWLPSRNNDGEISEAGLPVFPDPESIPEDIVLDMSRMSYMQTPITVPVLKPVQIRLDLPKPPDESAIKDLPDIGKDIEKIRNALRESQEKLPKVKTKGTPPAITLPEPLKEETILKMRASAAQMFSIFNAMDRAYEDFWESMGPFTDDKDKWTAAEKKLVEQKQKLECMWGVFPCVHVEMDLIERFTRIGSRPLVMLKEDYDSKGVARTSPTVCPREDHVCLLMHPERTKPVQGWEIRGPTTDSISGLMDGIRDTLRSVSFSQPLGSADEKTIPPYDATTGERIQGIESSPTSPLVPEVKKP